MGLESPVGGTIHTSGRECCKAQLRRTSGDVFSNCFQAFEVGNIFDGIACFSQQSFIDDDTVGFDCHCHRFYFITVFQCITIAGQFAVEIGTGQIQAIVAPVKQTDRAVNVEHGWWVGFCHFGHQGFFIGVRSSGYDSNRNTGLISVSFSKSFPLFVSFWFEVQVVNFAFCFWSSWGFGWSCWSSRSCRSFNWSSWGFCWFFSRSLFAGASAQREQHCACKDQR